MVFNRYAANALEVCRNKSINGFIILYLLVLLSIFGAVTTKKKNKKKENDFDPKKKN